MWVVTSQGQMQVRIVWSIAFKCSVPSKSSLALTNSLIAGRSEAELVQQYLQHISDGESSEERQDAVAELRDLLEGRPEVPSKFIITHQI